MQNGIFISTCRSGVVHVSLGAVTLRLDQDMFQQFAQEVGKYAELYRPRQEKERARLFVFKPAAAKK